MISVSLLTLCRDLSDQKDFTRETDVKSSRPTAAWRRAQVKILPQHHKQKMIDTLSKLSSLFISLTLYNNLYCTLLLQKNDYIVVEKGIESPVCDRRAPFVGHSVSLLTYAFWVMFLPVPQGTSKASSAGVQWCASFLQCAKYHGSIICILF